MVDVGTSGIADLLQDDGVVEGHAVKGDIEEKPGARCSDEDFCVLPLSVVVQEVSP